MDNNDQLLLLLLKYCEERAAEILEQKNKLESEAPTVSYSKRESILDTMLLERGITQDKDEAWYIQNFVNDRGFLLEDAIKIAKLVSQSSAFWKKAELIQEKLLVPSLDKQKVRKDWEELEEIRKRGEERGEIAYHEHFRRDEGVWSGNPYGWKTMLEAIDFKEHFVLMNREYSDDDSMEDNYHYWHHDCLWYPHLPQEPAAIPLLKRINDRRERVEKWIAGGCKEEVPFFSKETECELEKIVKTLSRDPDFLAWSEKEKAKQKEIEDQKAATAKRENAMFRETVKKEKNSAFAREYRRYTNPQGFDPGTVERDRALMTNPWYVQLALFAPVIWRTEYADGKKYYHRTNGFGIPSEKILSRAQAGITNNRIRENRLLHKIEEQKKELHKSALEDQLARALLVYMQISRGKEKERAQALCEAFKREIPEAFKTAQSQISKLKKIEQECATSSEWWVRQGARRDRLAFLAEHPWLDERVGIQDVRKEIARLYRVNKFLLSSGMAKQPWRSPRSFVTPTSQKSEMELGRVIESHKIG